MGRGGRGRPFGKGLPLPPRVPHHPCQNFLFRSMGLCRSASGSRPDPVPRCCGGAARMEGRALPASSCPGRRRQRVPARRREGPSKSPRAAEAEGAGLPAEAGEDFLFYTVIPWRAKAMPVLACCRSVADISPAQRTVWTNPALWSATNQENFCFLRAGACGRRRRPLGTKGRYGQISAQRGKSLMAGSESGEEKGRGAGRARAPKVGKDGSGIRGQAGMPHQAAAQKVPAALGLHRKAPCRKGKVWPCGQLRSTLSIGMSRPTGTSAFSDSGPCPFCGKSCPDEACWEGEGV